jgi:predicted nucleotidyltransferase
MISSPDQLSGIISGKAAEHLHSFRKEICRKLPGKVERVVLFGSRARGDARRDSDYDVAVFIHGLDDHRGINHMLADIAYPHILKGVYIRPVAVPSDFLETAGRTTLSMNIAREGVLIS